MFIIGLSEAWKAIEYFALLFVEEGGGGDWRILIYITFFTWADINHLLFSIVHVTDWRMRTPASTAYRMAPICKRDSANLWMYEIDCYYCNTVTQVCIKWTPYQVDTLYWADSSPLLSRHRHLKCLKWSFCHFWISRHWIWHLNFNRSICHLWSLLELNARKTMLWLLKIANQYQSQ